MPLHHLTLSVRGRLALARSEAERRLLVRGLARVGGQRLLLFSLVDDHLHTVVRAQRPGVAAEGLARVIRSQRPDLVLKRPHPELIDTRPYLRWLVRYLLDQPRRHGVGKPSALWSRSCFQDLVGARLLPGFSRGLLRNELPRLRLRDLLSDAGLEPTPLRQVSDETLERLGPARVVDLAAGVFAVGPELRGRAACVVQARALAAQLGGRLGFTRLQLAKCLGVGREAIRRLQRREPVPETWTSSLRKRAALESRATDSRAKGAA